MGVKQAGSACGEGESGLVFAVLAAMFLAVVLVLIIAVVVLAVTIASGFLHEDVLWMYIELPEPPVLTA